MALESSLDSNCDLAMPAISPANGDGGFSESLSSSRSLKKEENLGPIIRMAQLNTNLASGLVNATGPVESWTSKSSVVHEAVGFIDNLTLPNRAYFPSNGINNLEPYISLPPSYMTFTSNKPSNALSANGTSSPLYQGILRRKRQQMENSTASTNLSRPESQICLESLPIRVKNEPGTTIQMLKRPRIDFNREIIPNQQKIQELMFKGLQEHDTELEKMINLQRQQNQQQQLNFPSAPQLKRVQMQVPNQQIRNMLQDQDNQVSFAPLVDSNLCSRRFMQYLYHIQNRPHDNNIAYWQKFVSEYYAPNSKKRWCFSTCSDIEGHATGIFYPIPMEPWCCDICSSRTGKGLEATFETLPRLLKTKFDSGVLDEILFLDLPHAYYNVPSGLLLLEYRKAIQESLYENFRVVHEGRMHINFRWDLKIVSWEFCVENHEEYLLRRLVAPQVDQLARAAQKYLKDFQDGVSIRASSEDFRGNSDRFVASRHQLARIMDLSLVNGLGYPKKFTRSLQIAEVVNCMKDLMAFSIERKMGPIESLNRYFKNWETMDQLKEKQGMELFGSPQNKSIGHERHANGFGCRMMDNELPSGSARSTLDLADFNHTSVGRNASIASMRRNKPDSFSADFSNKSTCYDSQSLIPSLHTDLPPYNLPRPPSGLGKNCYQHLIDQMLQEVVAANSGKSLQYTQKKLDNEAAHGSWPTDKSIEYNRLHSTERSNAASAQTNLANASRNETLSHGNLQVFSGGTFIKTEPRSPGERP